MFYIYIAVFLLFVSVVIKDIVFYEYFENIDLDYVVIHVSTNHERKKNIEAQEKKLGQPIRIFEAILGEDAKESKKFDDRIVTTYKYYRSVNELGCYMSHLMLLKNNIDKKGYTVVFEDDFDIVEPNLDPFIRDSIQHAGDFDILFLGHNTHSDKYKDVGNRLFEYIPGESGLIQHTHAYIIPNARIEKLYEKLLLIDDPIDHKYSALLEKGEIKGKIIKPTVVNQQMDKMKSTIDL